MSIRDRIWQVSSWVATLLVLLTGCTAAEGDGGCGWRPLAVAAAQADRREYVGKGERIELHLSNERTDVEPDVFPESPLRIKQIAGGGGCEIPAGDIRVRNSLHLSADETRLLIQEYSGSNDSIVLYDTGTCSQLAQLDISGAKWILQPQGLLVGTDCKGDELASCSKTRTYTFGGQCRVIEPSKSSSRE